MDYVELIIGAVSGGALATLLTLPSVVKKAKAEARAADIDNLQKAVEGWHGIADERQEENMQQRERIALLNQKIDDLYGQIAEQRDKYSAELIINNQLRIEAAKNAIKLCEKRNCQDRTPPTGF